MDEEVDCTVDEAPPSEVVSLTSREWIEVDLKGAPIAPQSHVNLDGEDHLHMPAESEDVAVEEMPAPSSLYAGDDGDAAVTELRQHTEELLDTLTSLPADMPPMDDIRFVGNEGASADGEDMDTSGDAPPAYLNTVAQCFEEIMFMGVNTRRDPTGADTVIYAAGALRKGAVPILRMILSHDGVTFLSSEEVLKTAHELPFTKYGSTKYVGASDVVGNFLLEGNHTLPGGYRVIDMLTETEWPVINTTDTGVCLAVVGFYYKDPVKGHVPTFAALFGRGDANRELRIIRKDSDETLDLCVLGAPCNHLSYIYANGTNYLILGLTNGVFVMNADTLQGHSFTKFDPPTRTVKTAPAISMKMSKEEYSRTSKNIKKRYHKMLAESRDKRARDIPISDAFQYDEMREALNIGEAEIPVRVECVAVSPDLSTALVAFTDCVCTFPLQEMNPPSGEDPAYPLLFATPIKLVDVCGLGFFAHKILFVCISGEVNILELADNTPHTAQYLKKHGEISPYFTGMFPTNWMWRISAADTAIFSPHGATRIIRHTATIHDEPPAGYYVSHTQCDLTAADTEKKAELNRMYQAALDKIFNETEAAPKEAPSPESLYGRHAPNKNEQLHALLTESSRSGKGERTERADPPVHEEEDEEEEADGDRPKDTRPTKTFKKKGARW
jgi:hypothetical protein